MSYTDPLIAHLCYRILHETINNEMTTFLHISASNASSLGETSLLASRTSSFQRGPDSTRLATSPLVNPPQSPQLGSRTVVATALESKLF